MSYLSRLSVTTAASSRLEALRDDCVEISGYGCDECPLMGSCIIHRRMIRALDLRVSGVVRMHFVRTARVGRNTATFVRMENKIAYYRVTTPRMAQPSNLIGVPVDHAMDETKLSTFLESQVDAGTDGVKVING